MNGVKTWDHFFVNIPAKFVIRKDAIASTLGDNRATFDVAYRGLKEIDLETLDTVLELIDQNSIYRGAEFKGILTSFRKMAVEYGNATDKETFVWNAINGTGAAVSRIRNTAIGTLLVNIAAGMDLEGAVKAFESIMAPINYKRPTAVVSKKMVESAKKTIEDLGLTSALERRFATVADISVNNLLYVNRDTKKAMMGDVFDDVASESSKKASKKFDKVETVSIDKFIADILPKAQSLEVMFENRHVKNLVSLIAPADATAKPLFKWDNQFSWSYTGNMTDSIIKERVKNAGGSVSGVMCCRLAWFNYDDLDLSMIEPDKNRIYFGNRGTKSRCGGKLDVDMNAGYGRTREAVENIFYESESTMKEGTYELIVHNFCKRETTNVGFTVEIDIGDTVYTFNRETALPYDKRVTVAKIHYSKKDGFTIEGETGKTRSIKEWNIDTNVFHKANVLMKSPNHWDEKSVGNKHYFFMLENCVNPETARGFYNEFLRADLDKHRKVLEIVGSKMSTDTSVDQLSGLGFSETKKDHVIVRVGGTFNRVLKVEF